MFRSVNFCLLPAFFFSAALVINLALASDDTQSFISGQWSVNDGAGNTGVSAMQLVVVSETRAVIFDREDNNPLMVDGHNAWAAELNLETLTVRALNPLTNTWCATGSFLSNGTLVSTAGNPPTNLADGIAGTGLQAVRLFTPCSDDSCDILEDPARIRLTSPRWYPSSVRLSDGSVLILGGSVIGGFSNNASVNNPTYEFFPPKNINGFNGLQIPIGFLNETLNANQFPITVLLPDDNLFIAANQQAMIFDWKTNTQVKKLPDIPNGVRITSQFPAGATLLSLTPENQYTPEILICGGSTMSDTVNTSTISSQSPTTSAQCLRMVLTPEGIAAGWAVETMPVPRVMGELLLLPDGRVVVINGAQTGVAGYGFGVDQIGQSMADHPAFTPFVYDPNAESGQRFSSEGIPASTIARMYHSTATLTPNGSILAAGSNPNANVSTIKYPTEYEITIFSPPYLSQSRPTYTGLLATVNYNSAFTLSVDVPVEAENVSVVLMDLGFATHAVHMDQRLVKLVSVLAPDRKTLQVTGPPSATIYPPGPASLFVLTDSGVPSFGHRTLIGTGESPPADEAAIANMLNKTTNGDF